nr:uncharacterized protein LOC127347000 [Lolium perenne]
MDPSKILNVRFLFGGEFIRIGPQLDYVGGDEAISEIERDKLSLQEIRGFLKDHVELKESMKLYFQIPGTELADGLVFLHDDTVCMKMADYICVGGVANVFVEYHGEEDNAESSSGSDFEDSCLNMSDDEPDEIITAEPTKSDEMIEMFVPNDNGVITQVISSPLKHPSASGSKEQILGTNTDMPVVTITDNDERAYSSDSEDDTEYMPHSEDSGEDSEVVELRKHARKFNKRMRDSKSWINSNAPIPMRSDC